MKKKFKKPKKRTKKQLKLDLRDLNGTWNIFMTNVEYERYINKKE